MKLTATARRRSCRIGAAAVIAAAGLSLTACGGGGTSSSASGSEGHQAPVSSDHKTGSQGSGSDTGSGSGSGTGSSGGTAAASGTSAGTRTGSAGAASDRCRVGHLDIQLGRADHGAGNIYETMIFKNTGDTSCVLRGFPGVSQVQDHAMVGKPATRNAEKVSSVRLGPGDHAHAVIHTINKGLNDKPCRKPAEDMKVYTPGSTTPVTIAMPKGSFQVCGEVFEVSPVKPGASE